MMKGNFIINGIDAGSTYGLAILEGSYESLLSFPAMKTPKVTDWAEEDGIEVDLTQPVLDSREITLKIGTIRSGASIAGFIEQLKNGAYHTFIFSDFGIQRKLRLKKYPAYKAIRGKLEIISLQFEEDNPLEGYSYQIPTSSIPQQGHKIDNNQLSNYGVYILEESDNDLYRLPEVKSNQTISTLNRSGKIYDNEWVKFKEKDVNLKCLLLSNSPQECARNLDSLLFDLMRPGLKALQIKDQPNPEYFYYKNAKVNKIAKYKRSGIWCEFTLSLTFTGQEPTEEENQIENENP